MLTWIKDKTVNVLFSHKRKKYQNHFQVKQNRAYEKLKKNCGKILII